MRGPRSIAGSAAHAPAVRRPGQPWGSRMCDPIGLVASAPPGRHRIRSCRRGLDLDDLRRPLPRLVVRFSVQPAPHQAARESSASPARFPTRRAAPSISPLDRSNRAPLLRFVPLQRSLATPRCPGLPSPGRSRSGVRTRGAPGHRRVSETRFARRHGRSSPLRSFASAGSWLHRLGPVSSRRRPASAACDFCIAAPISGRCDARGEAASWPGRGFSAPMALLGFIPFAVLLLPVGGRPFPAAPPHLPLSCRPPRRFSRGTGR